LSPFFDDILLTVTVRAVGVVRKIDPDGRYGFCQAVADVGESKQHSPKHTKTANTDQTQQC